MPASSFVRVHASARFQDHKRQRQKEEEEGMKWNKGSLTRPDFWYFSCPRIIFFFFFVWKFENRRHDFMVQVEDPGFSEIFHSYHDHLLNLLPVSSSNGISDFIMEKPINIKSNQLYIQHLFNFLDSFCALRIHVCLTKLTGYINLHVIHRQSCCGDLSLVSRRGRMGTITKNTES